MVTGAGGATEFRCDLKGGLLEDKCLRRTVRNLPVSGQGQSEETVNAKTELKENQGSWRGWGWAGGGIGEDEVEPQTLEVMGRCGILFSCDGEAMGRVEAEEGPDLIFVREIWGLSARRKTGVRTKEEAMNPVRQL